MTQTGQTHGAAFDLDFHAIMHFGTTSRWTPTTPPGARNAPKAVLSFCAHDTRPRNLVDASAAERSRTSPSEVTTVQGRGSCTDSSPGLTYIVAGDPSIQ